MLSNTRARRLFWLEILIVVILIIVLYLNLGAVSTGVLIAVSVLMTILFIVVYGQTGLHR